MRDRTAGRRAICAAPSPILPASEVAQIAQREAVSVRKPEKGTIPKVFYIGADESVIQPEIATRPFMYKEGQVSYPL